MPSADAPRRRRAQRSRKLSLPVTTPRLVLRDFCALDLQAVLDCRCDARVTRHMPFGPRDESEAREHLAGILSAQRDPRRSAWELAVERQDDGRVIGACDLTLQSAREAEVGYVLGRTSWGLGFGTELAQALLATAFTQLGVERVVSTVEVTNRRSIRVLEKAGLRWDGTVRRHAHARGRWWDVHLYSLDRDAWQLDGGP